MSNKLEELSDEEISIKVMQDFGMMPKEQAKPQMPGVLSFLGRQQTGGAPAPVPQAPPQTPRPYPFLAKRAQEMNQKV